MAKSRIISKVALFTGVFVIPVFFILLFSKGKPSYSTIPYFGEHQVVGNDTINYTVDSFSFLDQNNTIINEESFNGNYLIVSILYKTCPFTCPMPYQQFKYFLYDEMVDQRKKFKNVHFLTHVVDAQPEDLSKLYKTLEISDSICTLVSGKENAIYDVNLLKQNPWQISDPKNGYDKGAYGLIILLDKQRHIRGVYQANQTSEIKRIENELVLLKREEDKLWYKK